MSSELTRVPSAPEGSSRQVTPAFAGRLQTSDIDALGTAAWLSPDDALTKYQFDASLFTLNPEGLWDGRSNGQLWLGDALTDEPGLLGYRDDRHALVVSTTRGGKGTGVIIPNLCLWPGSCVVVDPKGENATIAARRRGSGSEYTHGLGQKLCILDPFGEVQLEPSLKARFNPLDALDPASDFAVDDAGRIAAALVVSDNKTDPFWDEWARNLIRGLILHVISHRWLSGRRNLVSVRRFLAEGNWRVVELLRAAGDKNIQPAFSLLWEELSQNRAFGGVVAGVGEQMLAMAERTRSGVLSAALNHTQFIDGPPMRRVLEASDFDLGEIKTAANGLTLFLTLPQRFMETHYRWLRLMITLAVGEMERIKTQPATGHPTLFLLDEFAGLKRMEVVEHAAAQAAGFGLKFCYIVQNLTQLKDVYGDSWETFLGNAGLKLFFNIEDDFTRQYLSRQLGEQEVRRSSRSASLSEGTSESRSRSTTMGASSGTTSGTSLSISESDGSSTNWGGSSSRTKNYGLVESWSDGSSFSLAYSRSRSEGLSRSDSSSFTTSRSTADSHSESFSRTESKGWSEAVHQRSLLTPDEVGRLLARVDDEVAPGYPGLMVALLPGEQPMLVRRVNYFQTPRLAGFFDPHPLHPPPPTLPELVALRTKEREAERARLTAEAARQRDEEAARYVREEAERRAREEARERQRVRDLEAKREADTRLRIKRREQFFNRIIKIIVVLSCILLVLSAVYLFYYWSWTDVTIKRFEKEHPIYTMLLTIPILAIGMIGFAALIGNIRYLTERAIDWWKE